MQITLKTRLAEIAEEYGSDPDPITREQGIYDNLAAIGNDVINAAVVGEDWGEALGKVLRQRGVHDATVGQLCEQLVHDYVESHPVSWRADGETGTPGNPEHAVALDMRATAMRLSLTECSLLAAREGWLLLGFDGPDQITVHRDGTALTGDGEIVTGDGIWAGASDRAKAVITVNNLSRLSLDDQGVIIGHVGEHVVLVDDTGTALWTTTASTVTVTQDIDDVPGALRSEIDRTLIVEMALHSAAGPLSNHYQWRLFEVPTGAVHDAEHYGEEREELAVGRCILTNDGWAAHADSLLAIYGLRRVDDWGTNGVVSSCTVVRV